MDVADGDGVLLPRGVVDADGELGVGVLLRNRWTLEEAVVTLQPAVGQQPVSEDRESLVRNPGVAMAVVLMKVDWYA